MKRMLACVCCVWFWPGVSSGQQSPVFSGPQPGEKLTAFKVHAVTGPDAGKQVQLIADDKDTPRVLVFVHEFNRPSVQLLRPLDEYAEKLAKEGLQTHLIWLTGDKAKSEQYLTNVLKTTFKAPIVISEDGLEGPGNYGLNRKMTITVLVAKGTKVVDNFAIVQPNETDAPKVTAAVAKMMGKTPPTMEELLGKLKTPVRDKDKKGGAISADLQVLMRQMIQPNNDEAAVAAVADQMKRWAGDDRAKLEELRSYCRTVLDLGYGSDACKKALAKLAGK